MSSTVLENDGLHTAKLTFIGRQGNVLVDA